VTQILIPVPRTDLFRVSLLTAARNQDGTGNKRTVVSVTADELNMITPATAAGMRVDNVRRRAKEGRLLRQPSLADRPAAAGPVFANISEGATQ
jgi:hypothetical protein